MNTLNQTEKLYELHEEYQNKLLVINAFYSTELSNSVSESEKEMTYASFRRFYEIMGEFTDRLGKESHINKKIEIAIERDNYLNAIMNNYNIEYKVEEDEIKK